jgi:hypothetical protein
VVLRRGGFDGGIEKTGSWWPVFFWSGVW